MGKTGTTYMLYISTTKPNSNPNNPNPTYPTDPTKPYHLTALFKVYNDRPDDCYVAFQRRPVSYTLAKSPNHRQRGTKIVIFNQSINQSIYLLITSQHKMTIKHKCESKMYKAQ